MDIFLKSIADKLGVDVSKLKELSEADKPVEVDGTFFTPEELEASNKAVAEKKGAETLKEINEALGVKSNTIEALNSAVAEKFADNDSKDEIKKLNLAIEEKDKEIGELSEKSGKLGKENTSLRISSKIDAIMPEGYAIAAEAKKTLFLSSNKVGFSENGDLVYVDDNGNPKLDSKNKQIPVSTESFAEYLDANKIPKLDQGGEGNQNAQSTNIKRTGSNGGGKHANINNISQLNDYAEKNGISVGSSQYSALVVEVRNSNPNYKTS